MTGPEHYCEAQRLLAMRPGGRIYGDQIWHRPSPEDVARAQVHATLALAAATALTTRPHGMPPADTTAWMATAAEPTRTEDAA